MPFTSNLVMLAAVCGLAVPTFAQQPGSPSAREMELLERIAKLEARLTALERVVAPAAPAVAPVVAPAVQPAHAAAVNPEINPTSGLQDTTLNFYFDGYYAWNTNQPIGRTNLLRAYDVTSNSFNINHTGMIVEKAADPAAGRRWGYRLDLMYGQATETLQGSQASEPRPAVYRPVFQAYGTYVLPAGNGLTVDFGKWASTLGLEGNYTKDQINYSRGYFYSFLPFYHMGFRTTYPVNDRLSLTYWLVNGGNQTEDFNGLKSQLAQAVIKPNKNLSWTVQYYAGQEQRDIPPTPRGRFHTVQSYASWSVNDRLNLAGELDYVINRVESDSAPQRVTGGAAYLKYQFTPKVYFGQRYTRLNDVAGLFSGASQNLNDLTSTLGIRVADGFETRLEFRRDFSNIPYFLSSDPGRLKKNQNTITLGLLWWLGGKQGGW